MTERIPVVDDEKLIRSSLRNNLASSGGEVTEAKDGQQAIEILLCAHPRASSSGEPEPSALFSTER